MRKIILTNLELLIEEIQQLKDPSLGITLKESSGLLGHEFNDQVLDLKIAIKNRKKDESTLKLDIARLVKIKYQIPGLRIEFYDSKIKVDNEE